MCTIYIMFSTARLTYANSGFLQILKTLYFARFEICLNQKKRGIAAGAAIPPMFETTDSMLRPGDKRPHPGSLTIPGRQPLLPHTKAHPAPKAGWGGRNEIFLLVCI